MHKNRNKINKKKTKIKSTEWLDFGLGAYCVYMWMAITLRASWLVLSMTAIDWQSMTMANSDLKSLISIISRRWTCYCRFVCSGAFKRDQNFSKSQRIQHRDNVKRSGVHCTPHLKWCNFHQKAPHSPSPPEPKAHKCSRKRLNVLSLNGRTCPYILSFCVCVCASILCPGDDWCEINLNFDSVSTFIKKRVFPNEKNKRRICHKLNSISWLKNDQND